MKCGLLGMRDTISVTGWCSEKKADAQEHKNPSDLFKKALSR